MRTDSEGDLPLIEVQSLTKSYRSGLKELTVLNGLDLRLEAGETLSVRGESGCGKSTLLNCISGIESMDDGSVTWTGIDISSMTEKVLTRKRGLFIGYVFQTFHLVPELNVLENVVLAGRINHLPLGESTARAETLLESVGLKGRENSRTAHLSGGERQRVAIARALLTNPKVILADEPTGNLDEHTAGHVMEILLDLVRVQNCSLLLVTHHAGYAGKARRQAFLREGRLLPSESSE